MSDQLFQLLNVKRLQKHVDGSEPEQVPYDRLAGEASHKDNWAKLDKEAALKDFDTFMQLIGVNDDGKKWHQIARAKNDTPDMFNPESRINSLLKALDGHDCGTLASYIREAVDKYNSAQDLANKVLKTMTEGEVVEGEVVVAAIEA